MSTDGPLNANVTLTIPRFAAEELRKLAASRKRALASLAKSPLPGMRRHAEKRTSEAEAWEAVQRVCEDALVTPDYEIVGEVPV
jgi:hypothetical protein